MGVFSLLKHRPDFKHWHLTIASPACVLGFPFRRGGFSWKIRAVPVLLDVQEPVSTWEPHGNGKGFVPNAPGGKASTEMISYTRL